MELKDFVSSTLVEIAEGIKEAQDKCAEIGGIINPSNLGAQDEMYFIQHKAGGIRDERFYISNVEFDIALSNFEDTETKGGIGVLLSAVGLGVSSRDSFNVSEVTRVRFSVPVKLPTYYRPGN